MRLATAAAVTVLAVLAAPTVAGCTAGGGHRARSHAAPVGAHPTPLVAELAHIRSTGATRTWTAFGDLAAQRALGHGSTPQQLLALSGYGWSTTQARASEAEAALGLDGGKADEVVEVGQPHGAGRFDGGIDTAAVAAGAGKLGGHRDGAVGGLDLWRLGPDGSTRLALPVARLSRGTADFNVLAAGHGTLVRAASRSGAALLTAAAGGTGSLARDLEFRAVADCLGRPLAATLTDTHVPSGGASSRPAGFTTGAGVRAASAGRLTQVACRTTGSAAEAKKVAAALRKQLAHGRTRLSRLPWRSLLTGAQVRVLSGPGHVVEVTGTSAQNPDRVLEMMRSGDLSDLMDTDH
jgi:hypothetical protein